MREFSITRRGLIAEAVGLPSSAAAGAGIADPLAEARPKGSAKALSRLKSGNLRFESGKMRHAHARPLDASIM